MRICVPIPCFFGGMDFCDAIRKVGSLGFDCVETYGWKGLDLDLVKKTTEETGVELLSMCTTEFRMTDPAYRQAWLDGLKESCEAANRAGATRLITQVGQDTGAPRAAQHEAIVETLIAAKPILDAHNVIIMIEPLNTLVNHPLVKVVYDIYHQQVMEGNIIPNIVNNLDCIAHLHSAGHPGRIDLQFGENDYKFIFKKVDEAGYTGACGLEYRPTLGAEESLKEFRRIYLEN